MQNGIREWLLRKDTVWLQAVKYIGCGGIAVLVDQLLFYGLAWRALPVLRASDPVVVLFSGLGVEAAVPDEAMLERNYWLIKGICFVVANAVVYLLNRKFVFEAGRHRSGWKWLFFWGFVVAVWLDWLGWRADYAVGVGGDVCERGDDDGGGVDEFCLAEVCGV